MTSVEKSQKINQEYTIEQEGISEDREFLKNYEQAIAELDKIFEARNTKLALNIVGGANEGVQELRLEGYTYQGDDYMENLNPNRIGECSFYSKDSKAKDYYLLFSRPVSREQYDNFVTYCERKVATQT